MSDLYTDLFGPKHTRRRRLEREFRHAYRQAEIDRAHADALLEALTRENDHLRKLTATCTCGTAGLDYEGPQPDCAVCGAVRAFHAEQDAHTKTKRDVIAALEAKKHMVCEDGWYTCPAATEERDGGVCFNDDLTGDPCDCGRDARIAAMRDLLGMTEAA